LRSAVVGAMKHENYAATRKTKVRGCLVRKLKREEMFKMEETEKVENYYRTRCKENNDNALGQIGLVIQYSSGL